MREAFRVSKFANYSRYSLFNVTDKNFAAVLWAPDDVIGQVEYGTSVLGVAALFWLLQKHTADIHLSQFGQFQVVVRLTCRLKHFPAPARNDHLVTKLKGLGQSASDPGTSAGDKDRISCRVHRCRSFSTAA